jgi:hypothetical protein
MLMAPPVPVEDEEALYHLAGWVKIPVPLASAAV